MKLHLRNAYAFFLALIPLRWLEPIRRFHASSPPRSLKRKISETILMLLRYRSIEAFIQDFELADRPGIRFKNIDAVISRRLFWLGQHGYEGAESKWWEHFCAKSTRILEIGANIGFYTVLGARAAANSPYTAVEPHPMSASILHENVALNDLRNVEIVEGAVVGARSSRSAELMIPAGDSDIAPGGAYLAIGVEGWERPAKDRVTVDLAEASKLVDGVDLIKLDVEGYEYNILSGVASYVESQRPTMFVEILTRTPKLRALLFKWYKNLGYRIFVATRANALLEIPGEKLTHCNFFQEYCTQDIILSAQRDLAPVRKYHSESR